MITQTLTLQSLSNKHYFEILEKKLSGILQIAIGGVMHVQRRMIKTSNPSNEVALQISILA